MLKMNQNKLSDLLELAMVLAFLFLIFVIYVPVFIWAEEHDYEKRSRFNMQNIYDVEVFYEQLTGSYSPNFFEAMHVVNSARDSLLGDSLYVGEQSLTLFGKEYNVDIYETFGFNYDTTFGFKSYRRDTILDTTVQIIMYSQELGRNDTSFTQKKYLNTYMEDPNFVEKLSEEPLKRVELIEYYKTFLPDSNTYSCPLTTKSYIINVDNENKKFKVVSPITRENPYKDPRFLIFSLKSNGHGEINDGNRSWD
ncbi:uncharacterized protein METZ01_LOCUS63034 [marine metagenome]|uniref:Uncharacterized protein n=1 Tax=marine metagenome TaxID=408172 RepID=A0A381T1T0_9ZZZZ